MNSSQNSQNMQDPYSAMMSSHQRPTDHYKSNDPYKSSDPYKPYPVTLERSLSNSSQGQGNVSNQSFYHGMQQYAQFSNTGDLYNAMTMPASMGQDYAPLPAHMGSQTHMNSNPNMMSRLTHAPSHTITSPTDSSPQNPGDMNLSNLSSPGPSTSRLSMSPENNSEGQGSGHSSHQSHMSSNLSPGERLKHESSDSGSVKSSNGDESGVPPKKRTLSLPDENRDDNYWEKRKKNNESAKRSREARRMKEEQIALRVVYLEQENLQLRTEVSLLKSEIEKLRCMLYNS